MLEEDDGLVLPGDALIPLDKLMLRYLVSVRLLCSEEAANGRPSPGSGGGRGGGDRPPQGDGSRRGDRGGDA
jgi:hypothetical protein